jgi:hypothetical protein
MSGGRFDCQLGYQVSGSGRTNLNGLDMGRLPSVRLVIAVVVQVVEKRRRIHTRYDRCAHTFFSTIAIAATVIFKL